MSNQKLFSLVFALILLVCGSVLPVLATPRWTESQIAEDFSIINSFPAREPIPSVHGRSASSLDEVEYFLHFRMLCDFLVTMQYTQQDDNFGGMIEGQGPPDNSIIQSDNTQEAIREWSQYGIWTGDTARYSINIHRAWTYLSVFPAWREEDGG
jgi:hypothetical protein